MKLRIGGLVDISTVDYRGHVTFMIFFAGCNFRCPFCQNAPLIPVGSGREVDLDYVRRRVEESAPLLDAVGASGGEPALQPGALTELFRWAKGRGLRTFLNTNASCPAVVGRLVEEGLVDHVAMDVKGPLSDPERLGAIIGLPEKEA
ncbi:TPA: radical SAM protein, partial [Candidatus Bathyarchaeota archaeon]|nr:radical SAM protein [Candidatus Bathyarchaeota archaeon]